jgi:hypothetical protein
VPYIPSRGQGRFEPTGVDAVPVEDREVTGAAPDVIHVPDDQVLIPSLRRGSGFALVAKFDEVRSARGWHQYGSDLEFIDGRPFGALFYRRVTDSVEARVGVEWDEHVQQLHCPVLHASEPRPNDTLGDEDLWHLELDARARIGTAMATLAYLGTLVSTSERSRAAIMRASGLDMPTPVPADE